MYFLGIRYCLPTFTDDSSPVLRMLYTVFRPMDRKFITSSGVSTSGYSARTLFLCVFVVVLFCFNLYPPFISQIVFPI